MLIKDARFGAPACVGSAVSTRVRQLKSYQQAVNRSRRLPVFLNQRVSQPRETIARVLIDQQLIRISATVLPYCNSLTAPNEFCSAASEVPPPSIRQFGRHSIARAIPTFHRMDGKSISDCESVQARGRGERRGSHNNLIIAGDSNFVVLKVALKGVDSMNTANVKVIGHRK